VFNGTDDKINLPVSIEALETVSLSVWAKAPSTTTGGDDYIISFSDGTSANGADIVQSNGIFRWYMAAHPSVVSFHDAGTVVPGQWQHLCMVMTGSRKLAYVDGVEVLDVAAVTTGGGIKNSDMKGSLGKFGHDSSGFHWTGSITDARVMTRAI